MVVITWNFLCLYMGRFSHTSNGEIVKIKYNFLLSDTHIPKLYFEE